MFLIGKQRDGEIIGWLHNAKGPQATQGMVRTGTIQIFWTKKVRQAKAYQTADDARHICSQIWGDRHPRDVTVHDARRDEIESGALDISK